MALYLSVELTFFFVGDFAHWVSFRGTELFSCACHAMRKKHSMVHEKFSLQYEGKSKAISCPLLPR